MGLVCDALDSIKFQTQHGIRLLKRPQSTRFLPWRESAEMLTSLRCCLQKKCPARLTSFRVRASFTSMSHGPPTSAAPEKVRPADTDLTRGQSASWWGTCPPTGGETQPCGLLRWTSMLVGPKSSYSWAARISIEKVARLDLFEHILREPILTSTDPDEHAASPAKSSPL